MPHTKAGTPDPHADTNKPAARGRPRSKEAMNSVLGAAYSLAAEGGLKSATIEAIALRSKVSKVTIYKWWEDRLALLTDAFLWHIQTELTFDKSDDPVRAIHLHARQYAQELKGDLGNVLRAVLAECLAKTGDAMVFRERYLAARRRLGVRIIAAGQDTGAIPAKATALALYDRIYGAIFYRFLFDIRALSKDFVKALVDDTLGTSVIT